MYLAISLVFETDTIVRILFCFGAFQEAIHFFKYFVFSSLYLSHNDNDFLVDAYVYYQVLSYLLR